MNILNKSLDQMENCFTSNEFSKVARKNGISQRQVNSGILAAFLHENAIQGTTRRIWFKNQSQESQIKVKNYAKNDSIENAINFLKNNGYRVMKQVTDWIEL